ncbi:GNAT family N-acetyltransferase [Rossellomorea sp. DA94]|uniref:GNAT family N-acetyltransferase n=1 Tax=Rossellomorea sp. DA94 TaxID=3038653 RepID=UPI0024494E99|nr:GNAT family N-acetyltransferase [Rossellomorea sp. DA94]WGG44578.1 GNAT family N-acetyltransferase [Rossellomorea sp. DA94]
MISELVPTGFYKCKKLLEHDGPLESKAAIEGTQSDRIFVDDPMSPASGFIWLGSNNGFIFIGNEENAGFNSQLNHHFNTVIKPDANRMGLTSFEAIGDHPKWNKTIKNVFGENLKGYNQKVFELQKDHYIKEHEPPLEPGYETVKITKSVVENNGSEIYRNIEFLQSKVLQFWPLFERFFRQGVGYMVVYKNEIVSICFSGVVAGYVHGIDIETLPHHQGKKLAQRVAHAFVQDCLENGITPYWDCMEINEPSVSVAEKLGFRNKHNYMWYSVPFG